MMGISKKKKKQHNRDTCQVTGERTKVTPQYKYETISDFFCFFKIPTAWTGTSDALWVNEDYYTSR